MSKCIICSETLPNIYLRVCSECFEHVKKQDYKYIAEKHWEYWQKNKHREINLTSPEFQKVYTNHFIKQFCRSLGIKYLDSKKIIEELAKLAINEYHNPSNDLAEVILSVTLFLEKYDR
jgi:hypothetical protein